jgi:hypothetical protein
MTNSNPTGPVSVGDTAITVTDTILVSNAYYISGEKLTVTLSGPAGFTPIVTSVTLTNNGTTTKGGNGTYMVSDTLQPGTTPLGTYTWTVTYTHDGNNNNANDQGGSAEQFTLQNVVTKNEAATMGFWANNNGQKLLQSYTCALGNWLGGSSASSIFGATTNKLFGNLNGLTGTQIASYFQCVVKTAASGVVYNTYAQALTVALDIWVTTTGLGWGGTNQVPKSATSSSFGFMQGFGGAGLGNILYSVGNNGPAFMPSNSSNQTVISLLTYFNSQTSVTTPGTSSTLPTFVFYGNNNPTLLNDANNVFCGITQQGDIS